MRTFKSQAGPFAERPYYEDEELEVIAADELRKVGLMPGSPSPVRIDRFIEKRFGLVVEFDDLAHGILGFTQFGATGAEAVVLALALAEEGSRSSERRLNSTLGHEAGHMLLHGHLFYLERSSASPRLLDDDLDEANQRILCRPEADNSAEGRPRYDGRWWEYQANQMIGPLLMPRALVSVAIEPLQERVGQLGVAGLERHRRDEAGRLLADVFDVNPAAARVRLDKLFPLASESQLRF